MTDVLWKIFELVVTLIEEFIVLHFVCGFLRYDFKLIKNKIKYAIGSVVGTAVVTFVNSLTLYEGWLGVIYIAYWFLFAFLCVEGAVLKKLLAAILANMIMVCTSSLITSSFSILFGADLSLIYSEQGLSRFLAIVCVQITLLYVYSLVLKLTDGTLFTLKKGEWILILTIFIISFFSLVMMHMAFYSTELTRAAANTLLLSEIGLVMLNVICMYLTIRLSKSNQYAEALKIEKQQQVFRIQYAENIRAQYEEIRNMRHDMKQHFSVIDRLIHDNNTEALKQYTGECTKQIAKLDVFMDVGNDFVNAILNSKLSTAQSNNIEVLCSSSNNISGFNDYDLCNLLGNMLDNAIEGAKQVADDRKYIDVSLVADNYKLVVCVSNSIARSILNSNKDLTTSKPDRHLHGFGIKTIRSIAEKYNGNVDFYEEDMNFSCRVILFK